MAVDHYENFPVASLLVPARVREAVVAVYRFARAADDLADEGDATREERDAALRAFDARLDAIARGETPGDPPFPALASAIRRHGLALQPFHDLVAAFRQDLFTPRYATYESLLGYCARSANPVGRLMLALYGVDPAMHGAASDAICTALQQINFWQDVALDWRKGRVYLPQEDLARFGVADTQIGHGVVDDRWRALLAFECARSGALLRAGRPLVRALPWRAGLELAGVIAGGERILDRIQAVRYDVFRRRPTLRRGDWALVGVRALQGFGMAPRAS